MSILTTFLKLFKYTQEDKNNNVNFNIETALNENWDKIESNALSFSQTLEEITDNLKNGQYVSPAKYALISLEGIGTSDYCTITILGKTGSNVFQSLCGFSITSGLQQINMGVDLEKAKIISLNSINYLAVLIPAYSIVHFSPICSETLAKAKDAVVTYATDISAYTVLKEATKSLVATTDKIDISSLLVNGWTNNGGCTVSKSGNVACLNLNIVIGTSTILTLPPEHRPSQERYVSATMFYASSGTYPCTACFLTIKTNGEISMTGVKGSNTHLVVGGSFAL